MITLNSSLLNLLKNTMIKFKLKTKSIELCKLLKAANLVGSGGEGKEVISQGYVKVDGNIETRKRCQIHGGQNILFNEKTICVINKD